MISKQLFFNQTLFRFVASASSPFNLNSMAFHMTIGASLILIRMYLWDYNNIFQLQSWPQHDMNQGLAFFTTNMHCLRLTGDLAWWNPVANLGYPQYQQMFLSPMAPTPSHIVFILWSQLICVLSYMHQAIPEYYQYLIINYVVFPFLTYWFFAAFVSNFIKSRATVIWLSLTYALSGIGLWQNAWFYYQESFSLFFVLASFLSFMHSPTLRRSLLLLVAVTIQAVSLNYWTIYNSWFYLIFFLSYFWLFPHKINSVADFILALPKKNRLGLFLIMYSAIAIITIWLLLLTNMAKEQETEQVRSSLRSTHYKEEDALSRKQEIRRYTTELFNPNIDIALQNYQIINPMHNARYVGLTVLPLLLVLIVVSWRRTLVWLIVWATMTFLLCLTPPPLASLWAITPGMNRIVHLFYFYTQYWQLIVTFLAAMVLDICLREKAKYTVLENKRVRLILAICAVLCGFLYVSLLFVSSKSGTQDLALKGAIYTVAILFFAATILFYLVGTKQLLVRQILLCFYLLLTFGDLSAYFTKVSKLDQECTNNIVKYYPRRLKGIAKAETKLAYVQVSKNIESSSDIHLVQSSLKRPWQDPARNSGFSGNIFMNMPINNSVWPINLYIWPRDLDKFMHQDRWLQAAVWKYGPVTLWKDFPQFAVATQTISPLSVQYDFEQVGYNHYVIKVDAPSSGWLLLRHFPDKHWCCDLDGKRINFSVANLVETALPISAGTHLLVMDYNPFVRSLYKWCCLLLELWLGICIFFIIFDRMKTKKNTDMQEQNEVAYGFVGELLSMSAK